MVPLVMPPMVAAKLEPLARQWTGGNREGLPSAQRQWKGFGEDPKIPAWPLPADSWRVLPGGITFRLPGFAERPMALIADPLKAKQLWEVELGAIRRASRLLLATDGTWLLLARFKYKEGLVERKGKGYSTWVKKHGRARWYRAPEGWPRDKYGRPLSGRAIARAVERGELPIDTIGLPPRARARGQRKLAAGGSGGSGHPEHTGGTER